MSASEDATAASLLRMRSILHLLLATFGGFAGYVLLLPVVPKWAVEGGAGEVVAGITNGIFMLVTVLTQLGMPWLLRRVDHRFALGAGTLLVGAPTPLFMMSTDLTTLLGVSGLRGVGFGLLTVSGSALIAELVPTEQRGRAAGLYGIAAGLPNVLLLPTGVWLAHHIGYEALFWIATALPVLGTVAAVSVSPVRSTSMEERRAGGFSPALLLPWLVMTTVSLTAGGFLSFVPLAIPGALPSALLLAFGFAVVTGRWLAGVLGDRFGTRRVLSPAVLMAALGLVLVAVGTAAQPMIALPGAFALGMGFGAVQNSTLVFMFERSDSGVASTVWNIAYDAGSGIGAVSFGVLVTTTTYPVTFGIAAAAVLACTPLLARIHNVEVATTSRTERLESEG
ncbi:MFS transporter [Parasphingorhabdus pacifica]